MLAWFAAAVSLWLGARRYSSGLARGYRWLAGAAALYCAGLITQQFLGSALSPGSGLSFADLPPLLAVAAAAVGIVLLATAEKEAESGQRSAQASGGDGASLPESTARSASGWMRASRKVPGRSPDRWNSALNRVTQPITSRATAMT